MVSTILTHLVTLVIGAVVGFIVCYIRERKGMNKF